MAGGIFCDGTRPVILKKSTSGILDITGENASSNDQSSRPWLNPGRGGSKLD
jgi:hypothetical protein